ncbi:cation channel sperm-associated protein 1-like [Saccoglossus kowalevskii]
MNSNKVHPDTGNDVVDTKCKQPAVQEISTRHDNSLTLCVSLSKEKVPSDFKGRATVLKQHKPTKLPEKQKSNHGYEAATIVKQDEEEAQKKELRTREIFATAGVIRRCMYTFIESAFFNGFILTIILLNTGILCALTFSEIQTRFGWYARVIDNVLMVIYFVECALKMFVWHWHFFKEQWNVIDFIIVLSNIADYLTQIILDNEVNILHFLVMFRAMRALRALRVLRTVRFLKNLQVIMNTCLQSVQSMGAIIMLISLFLYMFAVIGRGLYADVDPRRFGNLWTASYTLFQLLTLDDWFYIYSDAVEADPSSVHIIFYLITYIAVEYFIFLNLFVAVLVDNFQLTLQAASAREAERKLALEECESEFEEDETADKASSRASSYIDYDTGTIHKTLEDYYPSDKYSERERKYMGHFLMLLASIECNGHILRTQKDTLDKITDLARETIDDM